MVNYNTVFFFVPGATFRLAWNFFSRYLLVILLLGAIHGYIAHWSRIKGDIRKGQYINELVMGLNMCLNVQIIVLSNLEIVIVVLFRVVVGVVDGVVLPSFILYKFTSGRTLLHEVECRCSGLLG